MLSFPFALACGQPVTRQTSQPLAERTPCARLTLDDTGNTVAERWTMLAGQLNRTTTSDLAVMDQLPDCDDAAAAAKPRPVADAGTNVAVGPVDPTTPPEDPGTTEPPSEPQPEPPMAPGSGMTDPPAGPVEPPAPPDTAGWTPLPRGTIRVHYPKGKIGGANGAAFGIDIPDGKRYRIRYELMPEGNFDFRAGGKLPGFAGGSGPGGGSQATDGWSGRLMWNQGGRLSFYFYRVAGPGGIDTHGYGTHFMWDATAKLKVGEWNTIEVLCDVTTGETIGILNGVEHAHMTLNYLWPSTDFVAFSTFFGGQGAQYQPVKDEYISFRNMSVKKER